jgi:hypothetical protein
MRRVLPLLVGLAGCTAPDPHVVDGPPPPLTAAERELDLKQNLRDGRSWEEQEQLMRDVKSALGAPSDADSLGPKTQASPAK